MISKKTTIFLIIPFTTRVYRFKMCMNDRTTSQIPDENSEILIVPRNQVLSLPFLSSIFVRANL